MNPRIKIYVIFKFFFSNDENFTPKTACLHDV